MPLNDNCLNLGATAMRNAITHVSLSNGSPEPSGGNQISAARLAGDLGRCGYR